MVTFRFRPVYLRKKRPRLLFNRRLDGPLKHHRLFGEVKIFFPCRDLKLGSSSPGALLATNFMFKITILNCLDLCTSVFYFFSVTGNVEYSSEYAYCMQLL